MKNKILRVCFTAVLILSGGMAARAATVYVDSAAAGANNGSSWTNAYTMLSTAMTAALTDTSIHVILVAKGTYYPTGVQSGTDRYAKFLIKRGGLKLYGGYPTGGGAQNASTNPTMLDGNINAVSVATDNSIHVIEIGELLANIPATADSIIIDGFTVCNGYNSQGNWGGGLAIQNCLNGAKTTIRNCTISGNAVKGYTIQTTNPPQNNPGWGAGIGIMEAGPLILNCRISGNRLVTGGPAVNGAGIGILLTYNSPETQIVNCVISGNYGSGIALYYGGAIIATNCTIAGNGYTSAVSIVSQQDSSFLTNCIIYGNAYGISVGATTKITHCIGQVTASTTYQNSTANPLLVSVPAASTAPFTGGDYNLQAASPAFNTGSNAAIPANITTDIAGNARIHAGTVDRGAYEYGSTSLSISGNSALCAGSTTTLSGSVSGGTFSSSNTAVATVNATTGLVSGVSSGSTVITYTALGSSVTMTVTVYALPVVAPISGSSWICAGSTTALSSATPGGVWSSSNSGVAAVSAAGVVTGLAPGAASIQYTVTANGCTASSSAPVTVHPLPAPVITVTGTTLSTGNYSTYIWERDGTVIAGATAQSYPVTQNGNYSVTVTANGCTGTSTPVFINSLGISAVPGAAGVLIYPNPATSSVHIKSAGPVDAVISRPDGVVVLQKANAEEISMIDLPCSVYIISLYSQQGALLRREKLIKIN